MTPQVIRKDLDSMMGAQEVMSPMLESLNNSKELPVVNIVVDFGRE